MKVISICSKLYRQSRELGIRECAKEIGISPATLSRIENNYEIKADSFIKFLNWLNKDEKRITKPAIERV